MRLQLNYAMSEAMRLAAQSDLENSIQERALFGPQSSRPEVGVEYEQRLLACADVLGALSRATTGWGVKGCPLEDAETVELELSSAAVGWIKEMQRDCREHVDHLSAGSEGDLGSNAGEVYLLHTLNHCLFRSAEAVPA